VTLRMVFLATAALSATISVPAMAQTAPAGQPGSSSGAAAADSGTAATSAAAAQVSPGTSVTDSTGAAVGTVTSVSAGIAVVDTGAVKASIPVSSFGKSDKGLVLGMSKAQLEAAARGAQAAPGVPAQAQAELKPGTAVLDATGGSVGTIASVDADTVTVATPNVKARLPKSSLALGPKGAVISMTQAQLEAAARGSKPPAG